MLSVVIVMYECLKIVKVDFKRHIINIIEKLFKEILFTFRFCVRSLLRGTTTSRAVFCQILDLVISYDRMILSIPKGLNNVQLVQLQVLLNLN